MPIPVAARITGIKTAGELDDLRGEAAADDVTDRFKASVDAYGGRTVAYTYRYEQDHAALYHVLGALHEYLRTGGDPKVARVVQNALDFAVSH